MATFRLTRLRAVIAAGGCHDGHDVLTYKSKLFLSLRQFVRSSNLTHSYFPQILQAKTKNEMPSHLTLLHLLHFNFPTVTGIIQQKQRLLHLLHLLHHFQIIFVRKFFEEKKYNSDTTNPVGGSRSAIIGTWALLGILINKKP